MQKKYLYIAVMVILTGVLPYKKSFSQMPPEKQSGSSTLLSKRGYTVLPDSGDWALSVDASPFLSYFGALFSDKGASSPSVNSLANYPLTIGGKYFIKSNEAYRAKVRIALQSKTLTNSVVDNVNTVLDTVYIKDKFKKSNSEITLAFGKEYRRGKNRLQGLYGIEGILGVSSTKSMYSYGNSFSNLNVSPTSTDFTTTSPTGYASYQANKRIQSENSGLGLKVAARGFVGVEYFILPKMSLGVEFGISVMYFNQNDGKISTESWDIANGSVKNNTLAKSGTKSFGIDNDNSGGALMFNFHF
ncbi:MAG: hypothetical protein IT238_05125 [Bacteroidia bacterium]|nr:hypothetical protein [Bacteroidia bacterium]MCZ2248323.1 hypothetical protein [Bacteroidia bacterium]